MRERITNTIQQEVSSNIKCEPYGLPCEDGRYCAVRALIAATRQLSDPSQEAFMKFISENPQYVKCILKSKD